MVLHSDVYDVSNLTWPNCSCDITSRTISLTIFVISTTTPSCGTVGWAPTLTCQWSLPPPSAKYVCSLTTHYFHPCTTLAKPPSSIPDYCNSLPTRLPALNLAPSPLSRKQPERSSSQLSKTQLLLCSTPLMLSHLTWRRVEVHASTTLNLKSDALNDVINFCFFLSHQNSLWISEYLQCTHLLLQIKRNTDQQGLILIHPRQARYSLVCSSCHNKVPWTWWLKQQT